MESSLVTAGTFIVPTAIFLIAHRLASRKVNWGPLFWSGFAFFVYFLMLRSSAVIPVPDFMAGLTLNWFGKIMSIGGTIAMLCFLPGVSLRSAGVTLKQNDGSLWPVLLTGGITALSLAGTAMLVTSTTAVSMENLLFQASMPGLDEELFVRGLLLLLFHQAFGKGLNVLGADTGWGFWLVVAIFGLLHGVTVQDGELAVNLWAILGTGFIGFTLTWMRERSGSLVFPILFHNVFNVALALA